MRMKENSTWYRRTSALENENEGVSGVPLSERSLLVHPIGFAEPN
jgi:hypothetical protein